MVCFFYLLYNGCIHTLDVRMTGPVRSYCSFCIRYSSSLWPLRFLTLGFGGAADPDGLAAEAAVPGVPVEPWSCACCGLLPSGDMASAAI